MYKEFKYGGFNYNYKMYAYTYIVFYAPNIILPMFVGMFMDRFGKRKTLIILSAVGLTGQSLLAINSNDIPDNGRVYTEFLVAKLIYGMGM